MIVLWSGGSEAEVGSLAPMLAVAVAVVARPLSSSAVQSQVLDVCITKQLTCTM